MNEQKIKTSQFMMLITSFMMGSTLLITMVDGIAGRGTWMVMIVAFLISIPFLLIYTTLAKRFPGKSLIEINDIVLGRVVGKAFSLVYLVFFFLLLCLNTSVLSGFYTDYIITEAPQMVLIIPILLVSAFAVKRGIAAIVRVSILTTIVVLFFVVLLTLLLIGNMDLSNFLPVMDRPFIKYVQATQTVIELPILELVSMLMVTPMLGDNKKLTRWWLGGVGVAMATFLLITIRDIAVLGAASDILGDNSYEAIRLIDIGEFLTRIELVIAVSYTSLLFIKISVLYYAATTALSQLLRIDRNAMLLPVGALAAFFAANAIPSTVEHTIWGAQYAVVFSFPGTVGFPLILFIVAAIRKLRTPPQLPPPEPSKKKSKQRIGGAPAQNTN